MNHIYSKILIVVASMLVFTGCAEMDPAEFQVEKPLSIELQEELDSLETLKAYVQDPMFKLGAGVSINSYNSKGSMFALANSNFQELTAGYGMKHGAIVQADGELSLDAVESFIENTASKGLTVYGHTLAWHANQNAEFLNSTIAPTVIPSTSEPSWDAITTIDFETDDATNYQSSGPNAVFSFTADGEGANNEGRALIVTNEEVRANDYESQIFVTFPEVTEVGQKYRLEMDVRADADAAINTQAQTAPGAYKHYNFFGTINATTEWQSISVEITIDENTSGCNTIAFNLGNTATDYYFDNIFVSQFNESGGSGPSWQALLDKSFETDDATGYESNGPNAVISFTADGEGTNGEGRALKIANDAVRANEYDSQIFVTFPKVTEVGQKYKLEMDVRADVDAAINTQAQTTPGAYKHYNFFGTINATTEWQSISVEITIDENTSGCNTIAFNLGNTATDYYFDNLVVSWFNEDGGGDIVIEKTPQEKRDTLTYHLDKWISGIMEVSKANVHAWDVVNEPMDDRNPYELKTGINNDDLSADEFYWQDYLGKDYAVEAFKMAAMYGNDDDVLFINDYNLEYNLDKCRGIIEYVEYIEENGARVDGIGTQMHIGIDSDKDKITDMLTLLAETGKQIKISELDIGVGVQTNDASEEMYMAQSEMYKFVFDQYFSIIPTDQQYGITIWSPTDSPADSSWRAGEPIGLWTEGLLRKRAYKGVVEGLEEVNMN